MDLEHVGIILIRKCIPNIIFLPKFNYSFKRYSRSGKKVVIHKGFYSVMPKNICIDGEIW